MCAIEKPVTSHLLIALLHRGRDTTALNLSNVSTFFYHINIGGIKASCTLTLKKLSLSSLRAPMGLLRSLKVAGLVRSAQSGAYIARGRNHFNILPRGKIIKKDTYTYRYTCNCTKKRVYMYIHVHVSAPQSK